MTDLTDERLEEMVHDADTTIRVACNENVSNSGALEDTGRNVLTLITALREERAAVEGLNRMFDLMWDAQQRAVKRWQAETEKDMVWPDHAKLVGWLLEKLDANEGVSGGARDRVQRTGD